MKNDGKCLSFYVFFKLLQKFANYLDILYPLFVSDNNVNNFDIFENNVKQEPELILSPKPLLNGSDRSTDSNSNNQPIHSEDLGEIFVIKIRSFTYKEIIIITQIIVIYDK